MDLARQLDPDERTRLYALLRSVNPHGPFSESLAQLHGFFSSVVSGPLVQPSEWLPIVLGPDDDEHGWESMEQAKDGLNLLMRFYNQVAIEFQKPDGAFTEVFHAFVTPKDVTAWCEGYILGILMREQEWREATNDPAIRPSFDPIVDLAKPDVAGLDAVSDPKTFRTMAARLPQCAVDIRAWWLPRNLGAMESRFSVQPNRRERRSKVRNQATKPRERKRKPRR